MFSIKIIKTDNHSIDLIDIFNLYRNCEIIVGNKINYIQSVNKQNDTLILSPKDGKPFNQFECPIKSAKLRLNSPKLLTPPEIHSIFSMVFNTSEKCKIENDELSFQCHSGDKGMVIDFSDGLFNVYASINNMAHHSNLMPFVHSFLITRKFDIFGLIKKGNATQI